MKVIKFVLGITPTREKKMEKSDKKMLKEMGKKRFIAVEKKDIKEAKQNTKKGYGKKK